MSDSYLFKELTNEEKRYLQLMIKTTKAGYIRDNKLIIKSAELNYDKYDNLLCTEDIADEILTQIVEKPLKANTLATICQDERIYEIIKALTDKERLVLFCSIIEEKSDISISDELKIDRSTVYRIRKGALNKIRRELG